MKIVIKVRKASNTAAEYRGFKEVSTGGRADEAKDL